MASTRLCCVLLATALILGCQNQSGSLGDGEEGSTSQLPKIKVNLPSPPSFQKEHAPENYSDGTSSIYGLRKKLRKNLNQQVKVKAYIVEAYECPCDLRKKGCKCDKPHLWLSDRASGNKEKGGMMVTGMPKKDPKTRRKIKWETDMAYHFTGVFSRNSGTGFSASDGLLIYQDSAPAVGQ
jgi:hypothetical protein